MTGAIVAASTMWDVLSTLTTYPGDDTPGILAAVAGNPGVASDVACALARFESAIAGMDAHALQETYAETFDFDPACALDVGWHLFGDSHERGAFMSALADRLGEVNVVRSTELPDHLSHVLVLIGRDEPEGASALAGLIAPAVEGLGRALAARRSPYAALIDAVRAALVGLRGPDAPGRR